MEARPKGLMKTTTGEKAVEKRRKIENQEIQIRINSVLSRRNSK